jgi:uncharacterized protein YndB with AHSA1/START domain
VHFEHTIAINHPVEKVFGSVSNPANLPEWQGPPTIHQRSETRHTVPGFRALLTEGASECDLALV